MSATIETLLADLTKEVRGNTESYIRLESILQTELSGLREDNAELKSTLNVLARTQANHGERLIVNETRVNDLQEVRRDIVNLASAHEALKAQVTSNTPAKTPWTAVVTAVIAVGALLYTMFGR